MGATNTILYNDLIAKNVDSAEMTRMATLYTRTRDPQKKIDLRDKILVGCLRFIRKVTIKTVGTHSEFLEDAFQNACINFLNGLDKYKPAKKIQFLTYIYFWIIKGINDEYHSRSIILLSKDTYKQDRFKNMHNTNLVYFDRLITSNDETPFNKHIMKAMMDKEENIGDKIDRESLSKRLDGLMLKYLSGTEYVLIKLRYFYDEQPTYKEISKYIGVSPQFLSICEKKSTQKLKKALDSSGKYSTKKLKKNTKLDPDQIYELIISDRIRRKNEKD
jgi:RNA polymerase sigma factor (sigma-70 family)